MKTLSAIRQIVRQMLNDEYVAGETQDFQVDEIDLHIAECLVEISERRPSLVKETLTTTANSRELDISSIEDLLEIDRLEYKTEQDPRDYRNFNQIDNDTIEIDTTLTPAENEDVFLYCHKLHTLTELTSTLSPQLETLLIAGTVAKAALGWINQIRVQVKEAVTRISDVNASIVNMSDRIDQAISDLTSGRPLIDETRAKAEEAIGNMTDRLDQAIADLADGRGLGFNKIYTGGNPLSDLANYASKELSAAVSFMNQARGYLSVDTPAGQFGNFASRELSSATACLNQAGGYSREISSRLSIAGVINSYQAWANNKHILYQRDLKRLTKPRTYRTYPKD